MRSHTVIHPATAICFVSPFVFKNEIEKEGLPRDSLLAWAQEVRGSNPRAPTKGSVLFSLAYGIFFSLKC
jgi:hypothetical protein